MMGAESLSQVYFYIKHVIIVDLMLLLFLEKQVESATNEYIIPSPFSPPTSSWSLRRSRILMTPNRRLHFIHSHAKKSGYAHASPSKAQLPSVDLLRPLSTLDLLDATHSWTEGKGYELVSGYSSYS
jgi:hypothetical protein